MTDKPAFSVSDVSSVGEEWHLALYGVSEPVILAFRSRKVANVARRLMKEIISRTITAPLAHVGRPPHVPVSWGELIDKITILEIKRRNIEREDALENICLELSLLQRAVQPVLAEDEVAALKSKLAAVNEKLWGIENSLREKESHLEFDAGFVELARSVYRLNDERSALKRTINTTLKSSIIEEKSYPATRA